MPDDALQTAYDEANRRGLFTSDKDFQYVGHELRRRNLVTPDPTQGGLVTPAAAPAMVTNEYGEMQQAPAPVAKPKNTTPPMVGVANGIPMIRQPEPSSDPAQESRNFAAMNAAQQQFESGGHPYVVQSKAGYAYRDPAGQDKFFDVSGKAVSRETYRRLLAAAPAPKVNYPAEQKVAPNFLDQASQALSGGAQFLGGVGGEIGKMVDRAGDPFGSNARASQEALEWIKKHDKSLPSALQHIVEGAVGFSGKRAETVLGSTAKAYGGLVAMVPQAAGALPPAGVMFKNGVASLTDMATGNTGAEATHERAGAKASDEVFDRVYQMVGGDHGAASKLAQSAYLATHGEHKRALDLAKDVVNSASDQLFEDPAQFVMNAAMVYHGVSGVVKPFSEMAYSRATQHYYNEASRLLESGDVNGAAAAMVRADQYEGNVRSMQAERAAKPGKNGKVSVADALNRVHYKPADAAFKAAMESKTVADMNFRKATVGLPEHARIPLPGEEEFPAPGAPTPEMNPALNGPEPPQPAGARAGADPLEDLRQRAGGEMVPPYPDKDLDPGATRAFFNGERPSPTDARDLSAFPSPKTEAPLRPSPSAGAVDPVAEIRRKLGMDGPEFNAPKGSIDALDPRLAADGNIESIRRKLGIDGPEFTTPKGSVDASLPNDGASKLRKRLLDSEGRWLNPAEETPGVRSNASEFPSPKATMELGAEDKASSSAMAQLAERHRQEHSAIPEEVLAEHPHLAENLRAVHEEQARAATLNTETKTVDPAPGPTAEPASGVKLRLSKKAAVQAQTAPAGEFEPAASIAFSDVKGDHKQVYIKIGKREGNAEVQPSHVVISASDSGAAPKAADPVWSVHEAGKGKGLGQIPGTNTEIGPAVADGLTRKEAVDRAKELSGKPQAAAGAEETLHGADSQSLRAQGDAALQRIKERAAARKADRPSVIGDEEGSGRPFIVEDADIKDAIVYTATHMAAGILDVKNWAKDMVGMLGEGIRPHLDEIWLQAHELAGQLSSHVTVGVREFTTAMDEFMKGEEGSFTLRTNPRETTLVKAFEGITREAIKALSPRSGVSEKALDSIGDMRGDQEHERAHLALSMHKFKVSFEKMSEADCIDFMDRIKAGSKQATPALDHIAKMYRELEDNLYAEVKGFNPTAAYLDNHFRAIWKVLPNSKTGAAKGMVGSGRAPLQGSQGWRKNHTLASVSEGLAKGGELVSSNPQVLFEKNYADTLKWITAQRMMKSLKDSGLAKFVKNGDAAPDGFVRLNDTLATTYYPIRDAQGVVRGVGELGHTYLDEGAARLLNNHLSHDFIRSSEAGKGLLYIKNLTTSMELSMSAFHAVAESLEAIGSTIGLGMQKTYNGAALRNPAMIAAGVRDIGGSLAAPHFLSRTGGDVIRYVTDPKAFAQTAGGAKFLAQYPDAARMIQDLFHGGAKLAIHEDYLLNTRDAFKQNLAKGGVDGYFGAVIRAVPAAMELGMSPLFEKYIPRLKIGMWMREYSQMIVENGVKLGEEVNPKTGQVDAPKITRTTLARQAWDRTENRLGEMNFDNMYWNRNMKTTLQLLFRSITWKAGNMRALGEAVHSQAQEAILAAQERRPMLIKPGFGWLIGMLTTTVVASSIIQKLAAGKDIGEGDDGKTDPALVWKDSLFPRVDAKDGRQRIAIPTMSKDWLNAAHNPADYTRNAMSSDISSVMDVAQNRDFFNVEIHPEDASWYDPHARFQDLAHIFKLPMSVNQFMDSRERGEGAFKQVSAFGLTTKAPAWIGQSPMEAYLSEQMKLSPPPRQTREQFTQTQEIRRYKARSREGKLSQEEVNQLVRDGKITDIQADNILNAATDPQYLTMFKRLSIDKAERAFELATPLERKSLEDVMSDKIDNADEGGKITPALERKLRALRLM